MSYLAQHSLSLCHTLAKSSELNASTLLLNLVFSQANVFMIWVRTEKGLGRFWFILLSFHSPPPFIPSYFHFFSSNFSLTFVKQSEFHLLEKCTFLLPIWLDWPGVNINTCLPTITTDHTFSFLSATAICKSLKQ